MPCVAHTATRVAHECRRAEIAAQPRPHTFSGCVGLGVCSVYFPFARLLFELPVLYALPALLPFGSWYLEHMTIIYKLCLEAFDHAFWLDSCAALVRPTLAGT